MHSLLYVLSAERNSNRSKSRDCTIKTYFISHQLLAPLSQNANTAIQRKRSYMTSATAVLAMRFYNLCMKPRKSGNNFKGIRQSAQDAPNEKRHCWLTVCLPRALHKSSWDSVLPLLMFWEKILMSGVLARNRMLAGKLFLFSTFPLLLIFKFISSISHLHMYLVIVPNWRSCFRTWHWDGHFTLRMIDFSINWEHFAASRNKVVHRALLGIGIRFI